jgi:hypothetical protein
MRVLLPLVLGVTGLVAAVNPAQASLPAFHTPTGNIGCIVAGGYLRCDIGSKSWQAPRSKSCSLDRGDSFTMRGTGRPVWTCHGDTVLHQGRVLAYGMTWHSGPFTCKSRIDGLTCNNSRGHGFFLSKQTFRTF